MKNYLVSVDGGGTKTELCVADMNGNIIKSYFSGSTNYKSVGLDEVYFNLQTGFNNMMDDLKIKIEDIEYMVFGISGCDSKNDYDIIYNQILKLNIPREKFYLCNDGLLAFYAQAEEPGIVVISGTGSIILGIDRKRNIKRVSGWGYYFNDMGSGYWIGNELLKRTLLYCDNVYKYSELFDKVKDYFNVKEFEELPYIITEITEFDQIARLSKLVTEHPDENEWLRINILNEGASYLSDFVNSVYKSLKFENEDSVNIVFSGGVLKSRLYNKILEEKISNDINKENLVFMEQINAPAFGGIKLAKMYCQGDIYDK